MTSDPARPPARHRLLRHWTSSAVAFLVVAGLGLVGTVTMNALAIAQEQDFLAAWLESGPAIGSLTIDLLVVGVAAGAFVVIEARRLGMRHLWVYLLLAVLVALAVAFPLFLAMRERRLSALSMG
jgi:hypothetical protein